MKAKVLSLLTLLLAFSCGGPQKDLAQKRVQGLTEMAELGTVEYTVKKIIKTDDASWFKYGSRKIIFTCTAFLKAGIDMKEFSADKVVIDKASKSISVTLPKPKLLSFNMPPEEIKQELSMTTGWRNEYTPEEKQKLLTLGEKDILEDVPNLGILDDAANNAQLFFDAMFAQIGYETVTVNFE